MHPLDSSLDASVHDHRGGGAHRRPNYLGRSKACRPRRTSLDNGVATTEELILLVTSSNKSVASVTRINSLDTLDNSTDNMLLSSGQWYNYSSDDDMMEESDYFAVSGYIKPKKRSDRGQRRLSLNNCTAMNMTFLANYNVSTADKSDLDVDCHNYVDEKKTTTMIAGERTGTAAGDAMSVGTRSSYQSNNDSLGGNKPHAVSDDDNYVDENYGDDDDDDLDSFGEAEDAEPADEEYIRKNLGASCIWNDDVEGLPPPPPVRRGGKKATISGQKMAPDNDDNEVDMTMVLTNTSNNSNPIPNDSARTTSSGVEEFTVVNTHPIGTTIVQQKQPSFLVYNTTNTYKNMNDPFHQDDDNDDDEGCDTMDIYHDETLDVTIDNVTMTTPTQLEYVPSCKSDQNCQYGGPIRHLDVDYDYNNGDDVDNYDDIGGEDDYFPDGEDSDCDSFCDANDDEKADKDYMKRVLGASLYWNNSMEDLSLNNQPTMDGPVSPPPTIKRNNSKRSASGRSNATK